MIYINYQFSLLLLCYFLMVGMFMMLYLNKGLVNYLLSLFLMVVVSSCILFIINYNFAALWLFMMYGGAIMMLLIIMTSLMKYELFEVTTLKFYKNHMWLALIDITFISVMPIKMLCLHKMMFMMFYKEYIFSEEMNFWLMINYLFNVYGNFIMMLSMILFIMLLNMLEIMYVESMK